MSVGRGHDFVGELGWLASLMADAKARLRETLVA